MSLLQKYRSNGLARVERCPICQYPQHNGVQLTCEPGVCLFRERPVFYAVGATKRQSA